MMNKDGITLRQVMDDITEHPLMENIPFDTVVKYAGKFIEKMGAPILFEEKQAEIDIEDWRAELPCDFLKEKQVMVVYENSIQPMHYTTSSYKVNTRFISKDKLTYKISGNMIYTSLRKCKVLIAYKAMKLDDEGYPLIHNDQIFVDAFESFIKFKWFNILFDLGKINSKVFEYAEREYRLNAAQAGEHLTTPHIEQWENIGNILNSVIIPRRANATGYSSLSNQQDKNY